MSDDIQNPDLVGDDLDLDEDLFNFASVDEGRLGTSTDDVDLDEIFASLEVEEDDPLDVEVEVAAQADGPDLSAFENMDLDDPGVESEPEEELIGVDATSAQPSPAPAEQAEVEPTPPPAPTPAPEPMPEPVAAASAAPAPAPQPQAPQPVPVPVAPATPAQATTIRVERDTSGSRSLIFMVLAITTVNALVALVTVKSTTQMRESVWDGVREVTQTAGEIRNTAFEKAEQYTEQILPIVAPDAGHHPTFELASQDIEEQRYADARRRLYALLAIIDRLDEVERAEVEAKANYMIAQTKHLEAIQGGVSQ